jgi:hypothetical protein
MCCHPSCLESVIADWESSEASCGTEGSHSRQRDCHRARERERDRAHQQAKSKCIVYYRVYLHGQLQLSQPTSYSGLFWCLSRHWLASDTAVAAVDAAAVGQLVSEFRRFVQSFNLTEVMCFACQMVAASDD